MSLKHLNNLFNNDRKYIVIENTSGLTLLGIAFIVLKLTNYINWSWWWVLAPIWIPWLIAIIIVIMCIYIWFVYLKKENKAVKKVRKSKLKVKDKDESTAKKNE